MTGRFLTLAALVLLSTCWAADAQAGPFRYRGPRDRWHGAYRAPAYGGVYSYPVAPAAASYYYAPSFAPAVYPAGGDYYGPGFGGYDYGGGHPVSHHHH